MKPAFAFFFLMSVYNAPAQDTNFKELGGVNWSRNIDWAAEVVGMTNTGVFLLFQGAPGCAPVKSYGAYVMPHPLFIKATEAYFMPLCIFNNRGGKGEKALRYFNEQPWNNPLVRIIKRDLKDCTERLSVNYARWSLWHLIEEPLRKKNRHIPPFIALLRTDDLAYPKGPSELTIGVDCFWMGANEIIDDGRRQSCAEMVFSEKKAHSPTPWHMQRIFTIGEKPKYYLFHSPWAYIPMTPPFQAAKANALMAKGEEAKDDFSPTQQKWFKEIEGKVQTPQTRLYYKDIEHAWSLMKTL